MSAKGYRYRDPIAAFDDPRWLGEQISAEEIATATADVECKATANVGGVMLAVETAYQRRLMYKHAAQLAANKRNIDAEVTSAARVLAGGGR
jgi:hypothetical protein